MTNILIIEDEARAARELSKILSNIDDTVKIIAVLDSVEQVRQWFENNEQPDLIFSDIQLADGICFDIYKHVQVKSPVIFCTAFDEYLMNAFDTNAVSYILKPVTREKVEKALDKFNAMKSAFAKEENTGNLPALFHRLGRYYKTTLLVNERDKIIPVPVKDIAFFYLDKTIIRIETLAKQKYFISSSLDEMEQTLDPSLFYRANRQFLINRNAIKNVERFVARKLAAELIVTPPEAVVISKAKASEFLKWLECFGS